MWHYSVFEGYDDLCDNDGYVLLFKCPQKQANNKNYSQFVKPYLDI